MAVEAGSTLHFRLVVEPYLEEHPSATLADVTRVWRAAKDKPVPRVPIDVFKRIHTQTSTQIEPLTVVQSTLQLPDVYPQYDGYSFRRLLPGSFREVFNLVLKGIGKVKNIGRLPMREGSMAGVQLAVHDVLSNMVKYGIPKDDSVLSVLLQQVEDIPDITYEAEDRAQHRAGELLIILDDAKKSGHSIPEGGQVLDVGCGDGTISKRLCYRIGAEECHGVDILSPEMIEMWHKVDPEPGASPRLGPPMKDFDYRQVSETDTTYPFEDGSMDLVMALESIHHIRKVELVASLLRKVKKSGLLLVKDHDVTSRYIADYLHIRHGLDTVFIEKQTPEQFLEHYYARYMTRRALEAAIISQGFRQVRIADPYSRASGMANPLVIYHAVFVRT